MSQNPSTGSSKIETVAYVLVLLALLSLHLASGLFPEQVGGLMLNRRFGVEQLRHLGGMGTFVCLVLLALAVAFCARRLDSVARGVRRAETALFSRALWVPLAGLASSLLFFTLRSKFINPDGQYFLHKFQLWRTAGVPIVRHDEMLEFWLHSRLWRIMDDALGWDLILTYQVVSSAVGGVFVCLLLLYCRRLARGETLLLFFAVASGGFMQLFFGDFENYTITATLVLAYLLTCTLHLENRLSILVPTAILSLAMCFHLLASSLGPSLAYLYVLELRRGHFARLAAGVFLFLAIFAAALLYFHWNGVPIQDLYYKTHIGGWGGKFGNLFASPSRYHYMEHLSLVLLLCPVAAFLPLLVVFRRIRLDPIGVHLLIAAPIFVVLQVAVDAKLGVYNDWNLFAIGMMVTSILLWRSFLSIPRLPGRWALAVAMIGTFSLHSYSWIVSNHFYEHIRLPPGATMVPPH